MKDFSIIFTAKNFDQSVKFYRDYLKLPLFQSWDRGPSERGAVFEAASGLIEILGLRPGAEYQAPGGFEISVGVEDVNQFYRLVKDEGLAIYHEIADKPWGARTFSVLDPDGVKLVFSQFLSKGDE